MNITFSDSKTIVLIERNNLNHMDYKFHILDQKSATDKVQKSLSTQGFKVFVDCDEDAILIEKDTLELTDKISLLWQDQQILLSNLDIENTLLEAPGLFPIFAIDTVGTPLMLAWGKPESVKQAIESGKGTYFSRSRNKKWIKGEDSGHIQHLKAIYFCLNPFYIIYVTDQIGAACHTGYYSCFYRQMVGKDQVEIVYPQKVEEMK